MVTNVLGSMLNNLNLVICTTRWIKISLCTFFVGLKHIRMPIPEFESPSIKQVDDFVDVVKKAKENNEVRNFGQIKKMFFKIGMHNFEIQTNLSFITNFLVVQ